MEPVKNADLMAELVSDRLLEDGVVKPGDRVVLVHGSPLGIPAQTNSIRLHEIDPPLGARTGAALPGPDLSRSDDAVDPCAQRSAAAIPARHGHPGPAARARRGEPRRLAPLRLPRPEPDRGDRARARRATCSRGAGSTSCRAEGSPTLLVHAIELGSFPAEVPGRRERVRLVDRRSATALGRAPRRAPARRAGRDGVLPRGRDPVPLARRRRDARARARLRRRGGLAPASSCRASSAAGTRRRSRATGARSRPSTPRRTPRSRASARRSARGERSSRPTCSASSMERFAEADLETDHPPIVAVNGHAGDPHYEPSRRPPTPIRAGDLVLIDLWARGKGRATSTPTSPGSASAAIRPPERLLRIFRVTADARDVGLATRGAGPPRGAHAPGLGGGPRRARPHRRATASASGSSTAPVTPSARAVHGDGANLDDLETHDTRPLVPGARPSQSSPASTCPRRGSGSGARSTCSSPADGPKVFSKIQRGARIDRGVAMR